MYRDIRIAFCTCAGFASLGSSGQRLAQRYTVFDGLEQVVFTSPKHQLKNGPFFLWE